MAELEWGRTRHGITFHTLRHSMATLARLAGTPEEEIRAMGNWRDRRMVDRYAKVPGSSVQRGAARLADYLSRSHTVVPTGSGSPETRTVEGA